MKINPWIFFTAAVVTALVLPSLIQDGMFMDGMLYTCVSHNLAEGKGTFWYPQFSQTTMSFFHEQPPLVFGIQSLFFRVFGDSMYVERLYSFFCTVVNALLIAAVWKIYFRKSPLKTVNWLPVLMWIVMPVTFWACANNMQENTMSIFVLLATLVLLRGLSERMRLRWSLLLFAAGGIFLGLAALSKGFPGLFPLVLIPFHWLFFRKYPFQRAVLFSLVPFVSLAAFFGLLLSTDYVYNSLHAYLFDRVVNSIAHVSTNQGRFHLLGELLQNLLPCLALVVLIFFAGRNTGLKLFSRENVKTAGFFSAVGLCGALPLMVTMEQRGFYLVTALPFFAFALAAIAGPQVHALLEKWPPGSLSFRVFRVVAPLLLAGALTVSALQIGKTRRDADKLADIYRMGDVIPPDSIITVDVRMWDDWALQTYLMRYFSIHLDREELRRYVLYDKSLGLPAPEGYSRVAGVDRVYELYRRNSP